MLKLITRRALVAGALATAAAGIGLSGVDAAPATIRIRKISVKPASVSGNGGTVQIKVSVSQPGAKVNLVRAQAQPAGQPAGPIVTLSGKGGVYQGLVTVPANVQLAPNNAGIVVYATTSRGEGQQLITLVAMDPGNSTPPPPPPK